MDNGKTLLNDHMPGSSNDITNKRIINAFKNGSDTCNEPHQESRTAAYNLTFESSEKRVSDKRSNLVHKSYNRDSFKVKGELGAEFPDIAIGKNITYPSFGYNKEHFDALNIPNDFANKGNMNSKFLFNPNPFSAVTTITTSNINESIRAAAVVAAATATHFPPANGDSSAPPNTLLQLNRANRSDIQFRCNQCGKCFTHSCKLQTHQRYHNGEKPFKCSECGKSFTQRAGLHQHHRLHTGEKPFKCQECGKAFAQLAGLHQHFRLHTGEKPFKCQECGKAFVQLAGAVQHQRTHSGEKPFGCNECGKAFSQRAGLIQHERLHTGEKPFNCLECGKCFTQLAGLNQHTRTHSGEKPFKCHMCGKCYSQHAGLVTHMKSSHASLRDNNEPGGAHDSSVSSPNTEDQSDNKTTPSFSQIPMSSFLPLHQQSQKSRIDDLPSQVPLPNLLPPNMQFMHTSSALNMFNNVSHNFSNSKFKADNQTEPSSSFERSSSALNSPSISKKSKIEKPYKCNICSKAYTQFAGLMIHQATHAPAQTNNLSSTINTAVENIFMSPNSESAGVSLGNAVPFSAHNPINMAKNLSVGKHLGNDNSGSLVTNNMLMNVLP